MKIHNIITQENNYETKKIQNIVKKKLLVLLHFYKPFLIKFQNKDLLISKTKYLNLVLKTKIQTKKKKSLKLLKAPTIHKKSQEDFAIFFSNLTNFVELIKIQLNKNFIKLIKKKIINQTISLQTLKINIKTKIKIAVWI